MEKILLVDDDLELCQLVREYLEGEGWSVETVHDGAAGAERATNEGWDMVILDVMLPGMSGFDALRRIRESNDVPVIMLTARGEDIDRIVGLELGADDYLPKPFNPRELTARMRAVLRRSGDDVPAGSVIRVGNLELDRGARAVRRRGIDIELTGVEFELLEILAEGAGTVITREHLCRQALGRRPSPYDRSLDTHMSNLRRKLGALEHGGERIKTIRGVGYLYVKPARSNND